MRSTSAVLLTCAALAALLPAPASAQSATEARLREALRTTTTQLRAAEDDRARLQASEAALKTELEAARAQLATARKPEAPKVSRRELDELNGKLAQATRQLAEQSEAAKKLSDSLARCEASSQDTARAKDEQEKRLQGEVGSLGGRVAALEAKNARMYQVGKDIIDWLSRKGFGAALAAREPFLGLKRVELENTAQDYEDKLLEQKARP
jgi:predicted  nucleic acid-binding Zn-ribbon protein